MKRNAQGQILLKGWTFKEISSVFFIFTIVLGIAGNAFYQNYSENQKKNIRIEQLQVEVSQYKARMSNCVKANEVFPFFYGDNPRSEERIIKAIKGFQKVVGADCFVFSSDKIYKNPYKDIEISKLGDEPRTKNQEEIFQGLIFEIDKGIPFLITGGSICSDGSYSGSVGRGTCSWHGGYASPRGYRFEFKSSEYEHDPRIELVSLQD
jgi:hypothetical protein